MRALLSAAAILALSSLGASALERGGPVEHQSFTCARSGPARVALQIGTAPCCEIELRCEQLLSTEVLLERRHARRT